LERTYPDYIIVQIIILSHVCLIVSKIVVCSSVYRFIV
jgi:hypothetical protein